MNLYLQRSKRCHENRLACIYIFHFVRLPNEHIKRFRRSDRRIQAGQSVVLMLAAANRAPFDEAGGFQTVDNAADGDGFHFQFLGQFGIGLLSKVAIVFLGAIFPILVNTMTGVRTMERDFVKVARGETGVSISFVHDGVTEALADPQLSARAMLEHLTGDAR